MKYLVITILFVISIYIGYMYSQRYKKRVLFFSELIFLAQKLDVEINFSRERLKKLIESGNEKTKKNLLGIDCSFVSYLNEGGELNSERLFTKNKLIKKEEQDSITMFFKSLGRSDCENQTKEIKNSLVRFEKMHADAINENKKFGNLGLKLGIIAGLAFVLILI